MALDIREGFTVGKVKWTGNLAEGAVPVLTYVTKGQRPLGQLLQEPVETLKLKALTPQLLAVMKESNQPVGAIVIDGEIGVEDLEAIAAAHDVQVIYVKKHGKITGAASEALKAKIRDKGEEVRLQGRFSLSKVVVNAEVKRDRKVKLAVGSLGELLRFGNDRGVLSLKFKRVDLSEFAIEDAVSNVLMWDQVKNVKFKHCTFAVGYAAQLCHMVTVSVGRLERVALTGDEKQTREIMDIPEGERTRVVVASKKPGHMVLTYQRG